METSTLKQTIFEVGRERDFYFTKLRDIEFLATKNNNLDRDGILNLIKTILYAEKELELTNESGKIVVKEL